MNVNRLLPITKSRAFFNCFKFSRRRCFVCLTRDLPWNTSSVQIWRQKSGALSELCLCRLPRPRYSLARSPISLPLSTPPLAWFASTMQLLCTIPELCYRSSLLNRISFVADFGWLSSVAVTKVVLLALYEPVFDNLYQIPSDERHTVSVAILS